MKGDTILLATGLALVGYGVWKLGKDAQAKVEAGKQAVIDGSNALSQGVFNVADPYGLLDKGAEAAGYVGAVLDNPKPFITNALNKVGL